ncbi:carboxymuconolactone decarboxylase family protein [Halomonas cupida]|uniref:carboxymuconolactone decarboxylase family protein n=1 Tax=Halomonas cupida TaxID=44933 RepID=UPI0039B428F2
MSIQLSREQFYAQQPEITRSLVKLYEASTAKFDERLVCLVLLRSSQLNGCAFCLHMHDEHARRVGETPDRLAQLAAWHEARCFSERERAALAWTEALTQLAIQAPSDAQKAQLAEHFSVEEQVNLSALIVTINGWNRIAVGFSFTPGE